MTKGIISSIITFNPNIIKLEANISSIINQVDELIIVDNFSSNIVEVEGILDKFNKDNKINIIKNCENLGISKALNQSLEYAYKNSYEWILTLDQDSICKNNMIEKMLEFYENKIENEKIIIIAPKYNDINKKEKTKKNKVNYFNQVFTTITSGSLTKVNYALKIGGFNEKLFIDHVDHEFCLRAKVNNLEIYEISGIDLIHEIGHRREYNILYWTVSTSNHSPIRVYYYSRNTIYLLKKYFKVFPKWTCKIFIINIFRIIKISLFEEKKIKKIKCYLKGFIHGVMMR